MLTSFAAQYDAAGYKADIDPMNPPMPRAWGLTRAQTAAPKAPAKTRRLNNEFTASATKEERRRNGASEDNQIGSMILDSLFNMAFPGLGMLFNPLSLTDMADVYDQTRSAFRRPKRQATQGPAQLARTRRHMAAPSFTPAR